MNISRPHEIVNEIDIPPKRRDQYIPLTPDEARRLTFATEDERAAFIANLPSGAVRERVARWMGAQGAEKTT